MKLLSHALWRAKGFSWEERRFGDVKLGLWRKTLSPAGGAAHELRRLVLIPGFGDSPLSWVAVVAGLELRLGRRFGSCAYDELVLIEFPGFGGALSNERAFDSMDHLLRSVSDTLDSIKPHAIVGHSLGAWLAALYAAGFDDRAPKLGPYAGPELLLLGSPSGAYLSDAEFLEWQERFRRVLDGEGFAALRPHLFRREPKWFAALANRYARQLERPEILRFMRSIGDRYRVEPVMARIRSETWLFWGENDTLIPSANVKAWLDGLTGTQGRPHALLFRDTGHSPQLERPLSMIAALGRVLAAKAGPIRPRLRARPPRLIQN